MTELATEIDCSSLTGQPVLLTGATGFIGEHLARRLLTVGAKLRILVRESSDQSKISALKSLGAEIVVGNVSNKQSVFHAVKGVEYVFHLAALVNDPLAADSDYLETNVEGARNVFSAAEEFGVKRIIYCSTIGVHSSIESPPASEREPFRPKDIYQKSKCEAEKIAQEYIARARLEVVIVRPAMVWGEGDMKMLKLFRGVKRRTFPVVGTGDALTHWIYIEDLINGFLLAATRDQAIGQTYILAGRRAVTMNELIETIAEKARAGSPLVKLPVKPLQVLGVVTEFACKPLKVAPPLSRRRVSFFTDNRSFDTRKAQQELGFQAKQSFEQEVSKIFDWYKENHLL